MKLALILLTASLLASCWWECLCVGIVGGVLQVISDLGFAP